MSTGPGLRNSVVHARVRALVSAGAPGTGGRASEMKPEPWAGLSLRGSTEAASRNLEVSRHAREGLNQGVKEEDGAQVRTSLLHRDEHLGTCVTWLFIWGRNRTAERSRIPFISQPQMSESYQFSFFPQEQNIPADIIIIASSTSESLCTKYHCKWLTCFDSFRPQQDFMR